MVYIKLNTVHCNRFYIVVTEQINIRENRRGKQEWIIQRQWKHWTHKTEDEDKKQNTRKHSTTQYNVQNKIDEKYEPNQNPGINPDAHEGYAFPASYRTPSVMLVYILW